MSPSSAGVYQISLERTANTPIPEGIHPFTVTKVEETESSNDNPMWVVTLACNTPAEEGKTIQLYLVLTEKARWKLEQFLDAVRAPTTGVVTAEKFVGRTLRAQISHEMYEGRKQAKAVQLFPSAGNAPAPVTAGPKPTATATPASRGKKLAALDETKEELPFQ